MNALLGLRGLACERGGRPLFSGLTHDLACAELLHVRGANGAGKTSLLRLLCGLALPAAGNVLWRGAPLHLQRDAFHRELVYIGHAAALKDDLSTLENLQCACAVGGARATPQEASMALAAAGLRGFEHAPARLLSQGQRKRAVLARLALLPAATLWVLDEPFNALDSAASAWLLALVQAQLARGGSVVWTSHQDVPLPSDLRQQVLTL